MDDLNVSGGAGAPALIETKEALKKEISTQLTPLLKFDSKNRHDLNLKLNQCSPTQKGSALIIAFEGTSAYEPLMPALMQKSYRALGSQINGTLRAKFYQYVREVYKKRTGKTGKWSGLLAGPFKTLVKDETLLDGNFDWYSFPSEESELLSGLDSLTVKNLTKLILEIKDSIQSKPRGIRNALYCTKKFFKDAAELDYKPALIVLTHSSGGRSAIKYLEHLKKYTVPGDSSKYKAQLVFTIDPVREAHEALAEVAGQLVAKPNKDAWNFLVPEYFEVESLPVRVWTRHQPKSLYKVSNVKRHINVYQRTDTEGIKMSPRFGIHGSRIDKADVNKLIKTGLGTAAHGEICYNETTIKLFKEEISKVTTP